jgi:hypothetical protein
LVQEPKECRDDGLHRAEYKPFFKNRTRKTGKTGAQSPKRHVKMSGLSRIHEASLPKFLKGQCQLNLKRVFFSEQT